MAQSEYIQYTFSDYPWERNFVPYSCEYLYQQTNGNKGTDYSNFKEVFEIA